MWKVSQVVGRLSGAGKSGILSTHVLSRGNPIHETTPTGGRPDNKGQVNGGFEFTTSYEPGQRKKRPGCLLATLDDYRPAKRNLGPPGRTGRTVGTTG